MGSEHQNLLVNSIDPLVLTQIVELYLVGFPGGLKGSSANIGTLPDVYYTTP